MERPFFTIITASFNAGSKLKETLENILSQTFGDYEVIVKDGGSSDGSTQGLPSDPRIRIIRKKDGGIYDGMNQALRESRGRYIYFLNCGDLLHERDVLKKVCGQVREAGEPCGTIFYGDVIEMQTGQHVMANPQMTHFAMFRYLPSHQACFYSADLFSERGFDTKYHVRADYEHFLYCVIRKGARALAMPLIIADYEGGGYSETEQGRKMSAEEHREITGKYFSRRELLGFRAYLILTLQPVREKIAQGKHTAALYDGIKNRIYGRGRQTVTKDKEQGT